MAKLIDLQLALLPLKGVRIVLKDDDIRMFSSRFILMIYYKKKLASRNARLVFKIELERDRAYNQLSLALSDMNDDDLDTQF